MSSDVFDEARRSRTTVANSVADFPAICSSVVVILSPVRSRWRWTNAAEQIRVNCICPAIVETELVEQFISKTPDPEAARKQRVALHPIGRFGTPEDIAPMAVYLASDESA